MELKEEAGKPSLLKKLGVKKFFHPYLTYRGVGSFLDHIITLSHFICALAG